MLEGRWGRVERNGLGGKGSLWFCPSTALPQLLGYATGGRIATSALSSRAGTVIHTPDCNFQNISGELGAHRALSPDPSPASFIGFITLALRALGSGFALNSPPPQHACAQHSVRNCFNQKLVTLATGSQMKVSGTGHSGEIKPVQSISGNGSTAEIRWKDWKPTRGKFTIVAVQEVLLENPK